MGSVQSKQDPQRKEAAAQNARIDRMLRRDGKKDAQTIRIILLGAGESGKSTIIKQMRIIHSDGFQEEERYEIRAVIYSNLIIAFRVLLEIMQDKKIDFEFPDTAAHADLIESTDPDVEANDAFADIRVKDAMLGMWQDAGVQYAVAKGREYALNDNLNFYFGRIDKMFDGSWLPDDQDMLHARFRTTGITETFFALKRINFRMIDVGGQRSERKKWIHYFEGVQCLLFVAALSGYDQCIVEDQNTNQMHEALNLFKSLVNGEWFKNTPIILFLNKVDLFRAKLATSPLSVHFPDYRGQDEDEAAAKEYFGNRFLALNRTPDREIYIHYTNATDTSLLKVTMHSVQDLIIRKNLSSFDLMDRG